MSTTSIKVSFITSLYRPGKFLASFLELYLNEFNSPSHELVLIHNDPTTEEQALISRYVHRIQNVVQLPVSRESVYASWNRGIAASSGEYLATWNVDDRRSPAGLHSQVQTLDRNRHAMIVSGDYVKVLDYNRDNGLKVTDHGRNHWLMGAPRFRNGCFLLWRRSLHEKTGYFDEQFNIAGDREFWYRTTREFPVARASGVLGYYLRGQGAGISRTNARLQRIESALISWRYAALVFVSPTSLNTLRKYRRAETMNFGQPVPLRNLARRTFLWALPSFAFFFLPYVISLLVEIRFALLSLKSQNQDEKDRSSQDAVKSESIAHKSTTTRLHNPGLTDSSPG